MPPFAVRAIVVGVHGYRENVGPKQFVGIRSEFRYDVDVYTGEGTNPQRFLNVPTWGLWLPDEPWWFMHPPEQLVPAHRVGTDFIFHFFDNVPWIGRCPNTPSNL